MKVGLCIELAIIRYILYEPYFLCTKIMRLANWDSLLRIIWLARRSSQYCEWLLFHMLNVAKNFGSLNLISKAVLFTGRIVFPNVNKLRRRDNTFIKAVQYFSGTSKDLSSSLSGKVRRMRAICWSITFVPVWTEKRSYKLSPIIK